MNKFVALAACLIAATPTATLAKKKPELSGLALQQIQARDYEAEKGMVFASAMTILQDSGYRILAADKDTGLITATASTQSRATWLPFVGFGRSKKTPIVSVFVEERGPAPRVRMNFVLSKAKTMGYGMNSNDEEPITDVAIYKDAFERLDKELFVRQSLRQTTPVAQPSVPTPAAAAAATPQN